MGISNENYRNKLSLAERLYSVGKEDDALDLFVEAYDAGFENDITGRHLICYRIAEINYKKSNFDQTKKYALESQLLNPSDIDTYALMKSVGWYSKDFIYHLKSIFLIVINFRKIIRAQIAIREQV